MMAVNDRAFRLHDYPNYATYVEAQTRANAAKLDQVWAQPATIAFIADYLVRTIGMPHFGLCHGTRNGQEVRWFQSAIPDCLVLGTEIAPTAERFPHTVRWDFHDPRPEWIGACDFVYSNSLDHAFDPPKALETWMGQVRRGGRCIIEFSRGHGPDYVSESDPFGADLDVMPQLLSEWGGGHYRLRAILSAPCEGPEIRRGTLFVLGTV